MYRCRMDGRRAILDHLDFIAKHAFGCEQIERYNILEDQQLGSEGCSDAGYNWHGDWDISWLRHPPT